MIIYLVTRSNYDDYHINKAFLYRPMAEKYLDVMKTRNEIYNAWTINRDNLHSSLYDKFSGDYLKMEEEVDKIFSWEAEPFGGNDMDFDSNWSIRELEVVE